ncbi:MAG: extracellular solute-binding protein, partial [Caldilineaceae bacterium]|nr:extracellular solute-binding protein [Caldilineaceae bacterium]
MSEVKQSGANLLSRRNFLRGVGTVGVGAMLAACAAPGGAPASGGEGGGDAPDAAGKEIKFYVFWGSPGAIADQLLADEALESYIGTGNTIDFKSGFNQEARLTAVASGTPPDIGIWGSYLDFMSRGAVIPLDDYIATSDVVKEENFISGNWDVIQYQGTIYGVPGFECFVRRGLNYNTRLVEEAGLDPDNPPVTWDELMVWHEALTKFDDAG